MPWTPISPMLANVVKRHRMDGRLAASALIEAFNTRAAQSFNDPGHEVVRAVSYRSRELTVWCMSPAYAAAVRDRAKDLLDAVRKVLPDAPVDVLKFMYRKPES